MRTFLVATGVLACCVVAGCTGKSTYTLYRNGIGSDTLRIHVATFDADVDAEANHATCERARELFQLQPAERSRYWCESGHFKKK